MASPSLCSVAIYIIYIGKSRWCKLCKVDSMHSTSAFPDSNFFYWGGGGGGVGCVSG